MILTLVAGLIFGGVNISQNGVLQHAWSTKDTKESLIEINWGVPLLDQEKTIHLLYGLKINSFENEVLNYELKYDTRALIDFSYYKNLGCDYTINIVATRANDNNYYNYNNNFAQINLLLEPILMNVVDGVPVRNETFNNEYNFLNYLYFEMSTFITDAEEVTEEAFENRTIFGTNNSIKLQKINVITNQKVQLVSERGRDIGIYKTMSVISLRYDSSTYEEGFNNGFNNGQESGYTNGYQAGFDEGSKLGPVGRTNELIGSVFKVVDDVLQIEILPGFKLWYIIGVPLLFGAVKFIIGLFY